jgi:lysophospholipase L1-like esterase
VRKHRTDSGLIRYDQRRDSEWAQIAREIITAEKPKFIVMMIGNNDRQSIREKAPPPVARPAVGATPGAPGTNAGTKANAPPAQQPAQPATPPPPAQRAQDVDPEAQPPEHPASAEQPAAHLTPEQARQASYGPWEFHTEKWEIAYIKRVDATISALKSAGVPVLWVGLPSQRGSKASADSSYLNEIYRSRADKAGITYVDIWDGFVDEGGRFSPQGPDYEGQIRRLRTGDGVYFTKFGARKLAHYVEREIERHMVNRAIPVALPMPADAGTQAPNAKPGAPAQRPAVGPVMPLTAMHVGSDELLGGGRQNRPPAVDAAVSRVLTKGEPIPAPSGRGDDFSWPRAGVKIDTHLPEAPATPASATAENPVPGKRQGAQADGANPAGESKPPPQRRPRTGTAEPFRLPFFFQNIFR